MVHNSQCWASLFSDLLISTGPALPKSIYMTMHILYVEEINMKQTTIKVKAWEGYWGQINLNYSNGEDFAKIPKRGKINKVLRLKKDDLVEVTLRKVE